MTDMTINQARKLCELIGGMVKVPKMGGYHNERCIVKDDTPYSGSEDTQPYLFHDINEIIQNNRYLNHINETITEIEEENNQRLVQSTDNRDSINTQITQVSNELKSTIDFKIKFGNDNEKAKALQAKEILETYT